MGRLFGTDGIRGEANRPPMDGPTGFALGRALVNVLGRKAGRTRVVLGKDTRLSGDMLEGAVASGVASAGGDVLQAGVLPTPGVAFLIRDTGADAGVMISASHNPFQDNGFKVFSSRGTKLSDEDEEALESVVLNGSTGGTQVGPADLGRILPLDGARERYQSFLVGTFPSGLTLKGVRIVLDTANGATSETAPRVFHQLGAEVEVIHDRPDGTNINAGCGSEDTVDLERRVRETRAHAGLAFDGDGDRLIAVDETGRRLTGDQILMILAGDLQEREALAGGLLVTTVMSNLGLVEACRSLGIRHHASRVGDRFVLEEMRRLGAVLGGEDSGHMIFLEHHTTGDGILSGVQLLACLVRRMAPVSEMASIMKLFPQALVNVEVSRKPDLSGVPEVASVIREVEAELGERGRVLVRYSGTQNVCRVMVEGPGPEATREACDRIARAVQNAVG
ncbi:MAG: phosphoglucosamine mutase [Deltaproteobacteria bacterium]|nr:phosphoglucosamine mutase [Deltaproteobacteria bacterium]